MGHYIGKEEESVQDETKVLSLQPERKKMFEPWNRDYQVGGYILRNQHS